ncbi:hypothetical protein OSB04_un000305 [Centaurea solstitialis]|uniref:Polyprotein n=1 Tax=Centaurea solstitialis TaxID=347529 RepID=A0AA38W615_9ASTR|nr:hypothetical protein OSB04_un000305 [Centaurea solstitialis]
MASTVTSTNNLSLRSILEKDKLTGSNFLDWERNLMIVLRHERKWYVLEEPLGEAPPTNAPAAARNAHKKHSDDLLDVACLMLATMSPDLQAGLINTNAYDMIRQLRDMFQTQARTERYDATKAFNECKMVKGTSVSDHVMKMKRHLDHLERLGHPVPLQLATDTILNSLSEDYRPFVVNYNMNNMEKTIAELHSMLKTAELNMGNKNKTKDVLMVKDGGVKKKNGHASTSKGKGPVQAIQSAPKKGKGKGKGKKVKPNKARTENRCFICNEIGHWRQNCPKCHEAGRNHSSTQELRKVVVLHIQELEVSPGSYYQLLNNSYKRCRLKVAQIFDRVANIGRDPRLRLLLGISHNLFVNSGLYPARRNSSGLITGGSISSFRGLRFTVYSCQFDTRVSQKPNSNDNSGNSNTITTEGSSMRKPIMTKYSSHVIPSKDYLLKLNRLAEYNYSNQGRRSSLWHVDSGCSRHMTGIMSLLEDFKRFEGGHVAFGDNPTGGKISGKGKVSKGKMTFDDVYYVEQLRYNLLSVSQVCDRKFGVFFTDTECLILAPGFKIDESQVMLRTPRKDNVYCLDIEDASSLSSLNCLFSKASVSESSLWHRRMCHMNFKNMNLLVKNNLVRGLPAKEFSCDDHCVACLKGKQHKSSHKSKEVNTISSPLQLLHMDLFGPTNVMSIGKKSYCLVIVDDYSRFAWVYFLRTKDETSGLIKPFVTRMENKTNLRVKVIRSDNGTEFKNAGLNSFCEEKGIERKYSAPRTPQQNGVAERRNRTLIEAARTMLADSKLPITFWAEAVNTACYVQNRVLIVKSKGNTPYELFEKKKPYIGFLKPFGCPCLILDTKTHLGKFDSKSDDGFLVGYSSQSKALRAFNNSTRIIEESDNVKCNENTPNIPGSGPNWLFDIDSLTNSLNISSDMNTGSGTEQIQETSPPFVVFPMPLTDTNDVCTTDETELVQQKEPENDEKNDDQQTEETSLSDNIEVIPASDKGPQWDQEPEVNDSKLGVDFPEEPLHLTRTQKNHPPTLVIGDIQSPMITRKQSKAITNPQSGMISVFLSQTETKKALDAMKDPSWIEAMQEELLQFVLQHVWDLVDLPRGHRVIGTKWIFRNKTDERGIVIKNKARLVAQGYTQEKGIDYDDIDVESAFLYGTIDEEVYVSQPLGFEEPKYPDKVYKLRKALYGLHQAPRAWYDTLSSYLLENKFERGVIDKTLFIKRTKTDMLLVQIYVDDIIFGSTKDDMCKDFEELMHKKFKMSSMGELTFFLGLQFGMNDAKPSSTPMETHKHLTADVEGEEVDVLHYRSMIGSLMYLTASRPDIMFAVCVCARYQVRPKESHLHAVKRIFKYLKGQPRLGLWYPNDSSFDLVAYTDSDYGGANLDRKSTSRGCQFLGRKIGLIANQMQDYGLSFLQTPIYIDNNSAISIVNNPVKHSKIKHIEIKYHFIRDFNEKKLIQVLKVHTDDQYADLFTKAFDGSTNNFVYGADKGWGFTHRSIMDSLCFVKDHNKIGYLTKDSHSEGFGDIVDFLASTHIAYATTIDLVIYIQHMQDFWANAVVAESEGVKSIQTTICGHSLTITPAKIRLHLKLNDETGITMLTPSTIMESFLRMGYAGSQTSLKYLKGQFCPKWRFFVHTLLHCFSKKTTSFSEFSSTMASALVCLATNLIFNFSQMIFDDLFYNLENINNSKVKSFYMFPRFVQEVITKELTAVPLSSDTYKSSALGHKVFANMKRPAPGSNDQFTPLFSTMMRVNHPQEQGAPSSSGSKPNEPISPQLEHSPSDIFQRDTPGVMPHSSIKKVPSKEKDGHLVGEAQTTDVAQGVHQDSLNIAKTPTTATPIEQSKGGPRCQETKGAASASARLKTSAKKLKDPVKEVNTPKHGEGRYNYQNLMADFKTIADDLKAHDANFDKHDQRHASHEERLDTLEKLATAQHDLLKAHDAQILKQSRNIQAQGAQNGLSANEDFSSSEEIKGELKKKKKMLNEEADVVNEPVFEKEAGDKGEAEKEIGAEADLEVNEDEVTIAQLLLKLPKVIPKAKGFVISEPVETETVKKKTEVLDPKDKGKKIVEEAESESDDDEDMGFKPVVDPVTEDIHSDALIQQLQEEDEKKRKEELAAIAEQDRVAVEKLQEKLDLEETVIVKKKTVKKTTKKSTPKAVTEKRRIMVRYLAGALSKPVQYFAKWDLEKIESQYNATREVMHLEAMEEQQVETEDMPLVQRKRKIDQVIDQITTTEGNADITAAGAEKNVPESQGNVESEKEKEDDKEVEIVEKEVETAEQGVEQEAEVAEQGLEVQSPKPKRKKSIAKKGKKVKEIEETSDISMWIYFEHKEVDAFKVFRSNGQFEIFASILGIFRKLSRADLKRMYEIGCTKEVEDFEEARLLIEDLKIMFAFSKTKDELKKNNKKDMDDSIGEGKVVSWSTYNNRVFSVTFEKGRMSYFLVDKRKKKGELSDLDKELVKKLKDQLLELNESYFDVKMIEQRPKKILEACKRENLKEMYDLRVKVIDVAVDESANSEKTEKMKATLECLYWLFEPFRLAEVRSKSCEAVREWRWYEKCRVYSLSVNDDDKEYYLEECDTDLFDVQRLQGMVNAKLTTHGEPTKPARLLMKKIKTYLKTRLKNLAPHV